MFQRSQRSPHRLTGAVACQVWCLQLLGSTPWFLLWIVHDQYGTRHLRWWQTYLLVAPLPLIAVVAASAGIMTVWTMPDDVSWRASFGVVVAVLSFMLGTYAIAYWNLGAVGFTRHIEHKFTAAYLSVTVASTNRLR